MMDGTPPEWVYQMCKSFTGRQQHRMRSGKISVLVDDQKVRPVIRRESSRRRPDASSVEHKREGLRSAS